MEESLPITISASESLTKRYNKLTSVVNKQEAQVNFQTLAAGWYEDEDKITHIEMLLVGNDEYLQQLATDNSGDITEISDDVMLYINQTQLKCVIAITDVEMELLDKEPKVLSGYISIKVKKVINEIAEKQGLLTLPL
ncbi:hypothetical protein [Pseudocolwellia agarivorans]|uniref:hypothetical protein n=1 Tax=Pseudocolwellia agarivorans TaxID=1911682 RepID=UPI003F880FFC